MSLEKVIARAQRVLRIESEAIESASKKLDQDFYNAVQLLLKIEGRGRVIVIGMGKSGHIGNKIAATLASTGTPAFAVHPAEAGHGDLGMITSSDVVIGISQSGKSAELLQLIPYIKRHSISLIAMTGSKDSLLASNADIVIDTSVEEEACPLGLAPTASTTLTLALGDALAVCLLSAKGFTKDDFAETHPNGLLGRKLLVKVSDVMSELSDMAVVKASNTIKESLPIIAKGQMGFAIVCDENLMPIGVFTDGDLRRCLDSDVNIKEVEIEKYMSKTFHSIIMDSLAVKAVDLMEKNAITALPVVGGDGKLLGSISMKQLLTAGVV
jgi:arabinose-5-phosphate isomerase